MYLNELNAKFDEEDKGDPRGERIVNEYNRWVKEGSRDGGSAFVLDESLSGAESLAVVGMIGRDGGVRATSQERTPRGLVDYGRIAWVMEDWMKALQSGTHELYKQKFDETSFNEAEVLEVQRLMSIEFRLRCKVSPPTKRRRRSDKGPEERGRRRDRSGSDEGGPPRKKSTGELAAEGRGPGSDAGPAGRWRTWGEMVARSSRGRTSGRSRTRPERGISCWGRSWTYHRSGQWTCRSWTWQGGWRRRRRTTRGRRGQSGGETGRRVRR